MSFSAMSYSMRYKMINQLKQKLADQPIRYKLFFSYFGGFIISLVVGACIIYYFVRETIYTNIENELNTSTTAILDMVQNLGVRFLEKLPAGCG